MFHFNGHWAVFAECTGETGVTAVDSPPKENAKSTDRVTGYQLHPVNKAALGNNFLAIIETGRFKYWQGDEDTPLEDGWWFWRQVKSCRYEVKPNGRFESDLRRGVPANHQTSVSLENHTSSGLKPTYDDRLLSAALIACIDEFYREGIIILGSTRSAIIEAKGMFEDMEF